MIPAQNIVAWGNVVPWADQRQVEQDLIVRRELVEIFSDPNAATRPAGSRGNGAQQAALPGADALFGGYRLGAYFHWSDRSDTRSTEPAPVCGVVVRSTTLSTVSRGERAATLGLLSARIRRGSAPHGGDEHATVKDLNTMFAVHAFATLDYPRGR